jgi:hypothetical protein
MTRAISFSRCAPHCLSSSAKADDPVIADASSFARRPVRTGCPACAGHDRACCYDSPLSFRLQQAISFSRCGSHPSHRHAARFSSLSAPTFVREHRRWTPASSRSVLQAGQEPKNERKKARKRNAERRVSNLRTSQTSLRSLRKPSAGAARAERCALASRRPTTALCLWDYSSQGSTWARLRDTPAKRGGFPASPCGTSSDAPRAPVIVPAG